MRTFFPLLASLLVAANGASADEKPDLDDPKVLERILKEAVAAERLGLSGPEGEKLMYQEGKRAPFTGWGKKILGNGAVVMLSSFKDGKLEVVATMCDKNGKITKQSRYKDGVQIKE